MLKRLTAVIAAVLLFCGLTALPVFASAGTAKAWLTDDTGILSSAELIDISGSISRAANDMDLNIAVIIKDLGQEESFSARRDFAENYHKEHFSDSDGAAILLIDINAETLDDYNYIYLSGKAFDLFDRSISDVYHDMTAAMEAGGVADGIRAFLNDLSAVSDGETDDVGHSEPMFKGVLSDLEDKFTTAQESELTALLSETAENIQCNVGVVITDDLRGKSDRAYADDFLDSTFGAGSGAIVLLYNDDRSNMNYTDWISANGRGTDLYGRRIDDIFDEVYAGSLGVKKDIYPASDYYESIQNFCRYLSNHKTASRSDGYTKDFDGYSVSVNLISVAYHLFPPIVIGIIVTITVTTKVCRGYSKKKPVSAAVYLDSARTRFLNRSDVFVREYTTHVRISSSSSHSSGSHRSGGGGHRSGRSGGGGRRR